MVETTFVNTAARSCRRYRGTWSSGKAFAELSGGPCSRGMVGDGDVDDSSSVVRENHEYEEQPECDRRYDEEVGGHDLACVIGEKGAPRLRRWTRMPSDVFGNGGFTHHDS